MGKNKCDDIGNHNQTKDEKSVSANTSLARERSKAPPMKVPDEGVTSARKNAYGSADSDFLNGLVKRIVYAGMGRAVGEEKEEVSYRLAVIRGAEPRHLFESMLALQMAAVHDAFMRSERNFAQAENVVQQDSAGRMLPKLARTFLDQLNALQRNRTGGDQKVMVRHVSVGDGGQAIVGHVTQAPRADVADKPAAASPPTSSKTQTGSTAIVEEGRERVPARRYRPKLNDR
jgi:hypothetical protein